MLKLGVMGESQITWAIDTDHTDSYTDRTISLSVMKPSGTGTSHLTAPLPRRTPHRRPRPTARDSPRRTP